MQTIGAIGSVVLLGMLYIGTAFAELNAGAITGAITRGVAVLRTQLAQDADAATALAESTGLLEDVRSLASASVAGQSLVSAWRYAGAVTSVEHARGAGLGSFGASLCRRRSRVVRMISASEPFFPATMCCVR